LLSPSTPRLPIIFPLILQRWCVRQFLYVATNHIKPTLMFFAIDRCIHPTSEQDSQSKATKSLMKRCKHFLDYMATHPNASIRYYASDMILNVHSDASYVSAPNARS
jgi:hypothetical protein